MDKSSGYKHTELGASPRIRLIEGAARYSVRVIKDIRVIEVRVIKQKLHMILRLDAIAKQIGSSYQKFDLSKFDLSKFDCISFHFS